MPSWRGGRVAEGCGFQIPSPRRHFRVRVLLPQPGSAVSAMRLRWRVCKGPLRNAALGPGNDLAGPTSDCAGFGPTRPLFPDSRTALKPGFLPNLICLIEVLICACEINDPFNQR